MIDTIRGYMELEPRQKDKIKHLIKDADITERTHSYMASLYIDNFRIRIIMDSSMEPYKLYFYGSLSKFHFGNNLECLNRQQILNAINRLSKRLNVSIKGAILTRLDIGVNIELDHSINRYTNCLTTYPRLEWMRLANSITFFTKHGTKALSFYDKLRELKSNSKETYYSLSRDYRTKNVLRYELRFKRRIGRKFKVSRLKVRHLYRERVYEDAKVLLLQYYLKVDKISLNKNPVHLLYYRNGGIKYLSYHGIRNIGLSYFNGLVTNTNFGTKNDSSKRSKMKYAIKEIIQVAEKSALEETLTSELDRKVHNTITNL